MPAAKGRALLVKRGVTVIAGLRTKGVSINNEPIDVTTDDEAGYRTLLGDPGAKSLDLSIEGITKDDDLRVAILASGSMMLTDVTITYPDGGILDGDFFFASLEETGTYKEAVTFSGSLQSSGQWTYTPGV